MLRGRLLNYHLGFLFGLQNGHFPLSHCRLLASPWALFYGGCEVLMNSEVMGSQPLHQHLCVWLPRRSLPQTDYLQNIKTLFNPLLKGCTLTNRSQIQKTEDTKNLETGLQPNRKTNPTKGPIF